MIYSWNAIVTKKGEARNNNWTPLVPIWSWSTSHIQAFNLLDTWTVYRLLRLHTTDQRHITHNNMADRTAFKLLPRPFTHRCRPRTLLHYITGYVHSPKAQAFGPSYAHKTPNFPTVSSLSFSPFEFFYSMSLTNYQAQQKKPNQQPSSPSKKTTHQLSIQVLLHPRPLSLHSFSSPKNNLLSFYTTDPLLRPSIPPVFPPLACSTSLILFAIS